MSDIALIHATFPDIGAAERIAETVVSERLAACANILAPCLSIFRWHGQVEQAREVPVLFKTTSGLAAALEARITALHPYELPVIEAWPVAASAAVQRWIAAETGA